jgi:hypothetical protein
VKDVKVFIELSLYFSVELKFIKQKAGGQAEWLKK